MRVWVRARVRAWVRACVCVCVCVCACVCATGGCATLLVGVIMQPNQNSKGGRHVGSVSVYVLYMSHVPSLTQGDNLLEGATAGTMTKFCLDQF